MKKIVMIFAAMAAVLSSCSKSELESVSANDGKDIVLNISVSNPGADTKVLIKSAWSENDEISIWYDGNMQENPDLVVTYDGEKWIQKVGATVSGNTPSTGTGKYAKALYNGTVKVASKDDYTYDGSTLTFSIANWTFLTEVQVVVKGLTSASAGSYTLACDKFTPLAAGNGYTVGSDAITASAGTKGNAVTGIPNTDGVAFVFATAEYSATAAAYKFTLTDNTSSPAVTKEYTATTDKISGTSGAMAAIKALTIASTKFKAPVPDGFVDLGVVVNSKPVYWATKNLGATNPEDYGNLYSWGNVDGQSGSSFTYEFSSTNYDETEGKNITSVAGWDKTKHDAAYKVDNDWRMPTADDFKELFNQCYAEWGTYNSVSGLIVYKAKEGDAGYAYFNSKMNQYSGSGTTWNPTEKTRPSYSTASDTFVFFPAAGNSSSTSRSNVVPRGNYWSSTWYSAGSAYGLFFNSGDVSPQNSYDRYYGRAVRPVSTEGAAPAPTPTEPDYVVMKMGASGNNTLKWATMNLGATTVAGNLSTCAGDYYQWGSVNTLYNEIPWNSLSEGFLTITSWKTGKEEGFVESNSPYYSDSEYTKYTDTDGKTVLEAIDDAVAAAYPGTDWRMPTSQEFEDLADACGGSSGYNTSADPGKDTSVGKGIYWCTNYDGVAGYLFCDGTNKLFFPAAGLGGYLMPGYGTYLCLAGSYGFYWSSSLNTDETDDAYYLNFESVSVNPQSSSSRYYGFPVRPVSD